MTSTIFIAVRAVDDGLTQLDWSEYILAVNKEVRAVTRVVYGAWISCPADPWRGASWLIELTAEAQALLRGRLIGLAWEKRQEPVVWAEANVTRLGAQGPPVVVR